MQNIQTLIGRLKLRIRTLLVLLGLGHLVLLAVLLGAATFACDYLFRLPVGVRFTLLGISLVLISVTLVRRLVLPLSQPISDDDAALCIESAYPEADSRIISSLQLNRILNEQRYIFSRSLARRLIADSDTMAANMSASRATDARPVWKQCATAGIFLAVAVGACVAQPDYAGPWLNRLFGGAAEYPRSTELKISYPAKVIKGDDVLIAVEATKGSPSRVRLFYKFESGDKGYVNAEPAPGHDDRFAYTFKQVIEPFRFSVSGGDYDSDDFHVAIRLPPRLEDISLTLDPPDYTRLPTTAPLKNGNVKAYRGTDVAFTGKTNIELNAATLLFRTGEEKPSETGLAVESDRKTIRGAFKVERNCDEEITLVSAEGLLNRDPVKYRVEVIPDRLPLVKIVRPDSDMKVTTTAVIPVTIEAADDFGLREMKLIYRVKPHGEGEDRLEGEEQSLRIPFRGEEVAFGPPSARAIHSFKLDGVRAKGEDGKPRPLEKGDSIHYYIQVADYNPAGAIGQSNRYTFTVVSVEEIMEEVNNAQRDLLHEIANLKAIQVKNLTDTRDFSKLLVKQAMGEQESKRLYTLELTQDQVTVGSKDVARKLQKLIDLIDFFKLEYVKISGELQIVLGIMEKIGAEKSPAVQSIIKTAGRPQAAASAILERSTSIQEEIIGDLSAAIKLMQKWADMSHVIRSMEAIKSRQGEIPDLIPGAKKAPEEPKKSGT